MNIYPNVPRKVMTILEARVEPDRWQALERLFAEAGQDPPRQLLQAFLTHSDAEPGLWRIIGVWESREALEEYRRAVEVPGGVAMFRAVGAEPDLTVLEVAADFQVPRLRWVLGGRA